MSHTGMLSSGMAYEVEDSKNSAFDDVVRQARENTSRPGPGGEKPSDVTDLKIILWGNGFQIEDDGPFRNLTDPANS